MRIRYKNGVEVLSNSMLEELLKLGLGGHYIYVPNKIAEEKDEKCIIAGYLRYEQGLRVHQVADEIHLGIRQTYYLLALFKKRYPEKCI